MLFWVFHSGRFSSAPECVLSGRSAAWLARLVRDQEAGGSNPLAPTILFKQIPRTPSLFISLLWAILRRSDPPDLTLKVSREYLPVSLNLLSQKFVPDNRD